MAKKSKANDKTSKSVLFGFDGRGWLTKKRDLPKTGSQASIVLMGDGVSFEDAAKAANSSLNKWQIEQFNLQKSKEVFYAQTVNGPAWFVRPFRASAQTELAIPPYSKARDLCGSIFLSEDFRSAKTGRFLPVGASKDEIMGALVGFELASYSFKTPNGDKLPMIDCVGIKDSVLTEASIYGLSMNVARHLTNLPPNLLDPASYSRAVVDLLEDYKGFKVEVWEEKELKKEGLNLLLAVGSAAQSASRLVKVSYRAAGKQTPFAVVGKGVTFDSGGLDIKPPAGMRFMKKDMGGSAALVGFAMWLREAMPKINCDIYLALAENAISATAMHPGDIIRSRQGTTVEIHNTDAEGRLILADALDVAVKHADAPDVVFDLATLTGAMRVAVGTELYGLFSNNDQLAENVLKAARAHGERGWKMPLVKEYEIDLRSSCADIANASSSGFAGAITAALFLERFVAAKPWIHIDMYGWIDRPFGPYVEPGGNGQGVMTLVGYAKARQEKT